MRTAGVSAFLLCVAAFSGVLSVKSAPTHELIGTVNPLRMADVDASTGTVTPLQQDPVPQEGQAQQLSAFDGFNRHLYVVGYNFTTSKSNLIGFDISSGSVVTNVAMPFVDPDFVGVGQSVEWKSDTTDGSLLLSGRETAKGPHIVVVFDPKQGAITKRVATVGDSDVLGGATAYDPTSKCLYLQLGTKSGAAAIVSVNVVSGKIVTIPQDIDKLALSTLNYDAQSKHLYGLAVQVHPTTGTFSRSVASLDPATDTLRKIANVPDWGTEMGGLCAIHSAKRSLFAVMQKTGANDTAPFYLVALDLATGAVQSSASVGPDSSPTALWSLEYAGTQ